MKEREEYLRVRGQVLGLLDGNNRSEAIARSQAELLPAYQRYSEGAAKLFNYNIRQGDERGKIITRACVVGQWVVAGVVAVVFGLGFWSGLFKDGLKSRGPGASSKHQHPSSSNIGDGLKLGLHTRRKHRTSRADSAVKGWGQRVAVSDMDVWFRRRSWRVRSPRILPFGSSKSRTSCEDDSIRRVCNCRTVW